MNLLIEARGEAVRYFEPNATALGLEDPDDLVGPDPVLLWLRMAAAGFADHPVDGAPRLALLSSKFDQQQHLQRWLIDAENMDRGQFRIVRNLLVASGVAEVAMYLEGSPQPLPLHELAFPSCPTPLGVAGDYTPPDEDDIVRHRSLHIELAVAHDAALARRLCDDLDVWIEVVCRSGWCPEDEEPANAGAMPCAAYALDSHTVAVEFDGFFRVDEACFDAISAYAHRLLAMDIQVASIAVS
jgi:hypothetical protein